MLAKVEGIMDVVAQVGPQVTGRAFLLSSTRKNCTTADAGPAFSCYCRLFLSPLGVPENCDNVCATIISLE